MNNFDEAVTLLQELLDEYVSTVDGKCEWEARNEDIVIRVDEYLRSQGHKGVAEKKL